MATNPRRILLPEWKPKAICKGATQLRISLKPQPKCLPDGTYRWMRDPMFGRAGFCADGTLVMAMQTMDWVMEALPPCPFGKPGDKLRVADTDLLIQVTDVRVQQVQEISHEDAIAEGCAGYDWVSSSPYIVGPHTDSGELPVEEFERQYDSIWAVNPWVWPLTFEVLEGLT